MANKNKAKGTKAETKVVKYLNENGIEASRKALTGSKDEGDIQLHDWLINLEVKTGKQTANYNRAQLNEWIRQSDVEGENAGIACYLVIVRYRRKIEDAEVWWYRDDTGEYHMQYLDDFVNSFKE